MMKSSSLMRRIISQNGTVEELPDTGYCALKSSEDL